MSKAPPTVGPHNPEFLTKKPWYLSSGDAAAAAATSEPTLEHQSGLVQKSELTLQAAEKLLQEQRQQQKQRAASGKFTTGQWVEALKGNKLPYRICQILKIYNKKQTEFDLKYEDGTVERRVKLNPRAASKPRIRMTKAGSRSTAVTGGGTDSSNNIFGNETFDSKRDQYHGYDHESHNARLMEKFQAREELRRKLREEQEKKKAAKNEDDGAGGKAADAADSSSNNNNDNNSGGQAVASDSDFDDSDVESDGGGDSDDDEFAQRDEDAKVLTTRLARQGGVGGAQMKVTARNLRIREDTAKYLRNLDPNSAYYDPKSRSMRDNPNPEIPAEASEFAGDNFARISGDAVQLAETQLFAWEASDKGVSEIHPQANPSQAELLKKQFKSKAVDVKLEQKRAVLNKYGGQKYLDGSAGLASAVTDEKDKSDANKKLPAKEDRSLRFGVISKVEEYGKDGRLIGAGAQQYKALQSKYEEDVFTNGHTCVWGSYFHKGAFQWGYADDHSLIHNSYYTGENGRIANDEANELRYGTGKAGSAALAQARALKRTMQEESTDADRKRAKIG